MRFKNELIKWRKLQEQVASLEKERSKELSRLNEICKEELGCSFGGPSLIEEALLKLAGKEYVGDL